MDRLSTQLFFKHCGKCEKGIVMISVSFNTEKTKVTVHKCTECKHQYFADKPEEIGLLKNAENIVIKQTT